MKRSDQQLLIAKLRAGHEEVLDEIYLKFRNDFVGWMVHAHHCNQEDAAELFQLTVIIFYENVINGKFQESNGNLKGYLFGIGQNKLRESRRDKIKISQLSERYCYQHLDSSDDDSTSYEETLNLVAGSLQKMKDPCKTLLELYYYQDLSMEEISRRMGYKSADTAKTQKYRCIRKLRQIYNDALEKMSLK